MILNQTQNALADWKNFSLPAVEYTDRHVQSMIDHDLTALESKFLLRLLGNMDVNTGRIHGHRISKIAKHLKCGTPNFYKKDNNLITRLNATGEVELVRRNKKIYGRILNPPKKRGHKAPLFPLAVSMIDRVALQGIFETDSKYKIRMMLMLSLHCDLNTGELNTEKRAYQWGDMIRCSRRTAERAIDWLYIKGWGDLKRDYVVTGRLEYTALARAFLTIHAEKRAEENRKKAERLEAGEVDYEAICSFLYRIYGINSTGLAQSQILTAHKYLKASIEAEAMRKLERLKRELDQKEDWERDSTQRLKAWASVS